uniref:Uncharacterized protein n=1 Tax=Arundo donax TaxID=35708 RepID=A0A0A9B6X9_ARUDO
MQPYRLFIQPERNLVFRLRKLVQAKLYIVH